MNETNIDHDTYTPLSEMEGDATFVEVIERLNELVTVVNAIVVTVNGTHEISQEPTP